MVSLNSLGDPIPSENKFQDISAQVTCEEEMATPDQIAEPLPSRDTATSAAAEVQGISSSAREDQIVTAPDQIMEPLPFQDTSPAPEAQGISSSASEDQIMATSDQIIEPPPLQNTSTALEAQGISLSAPKDQIMAASDRIIEPLLLQDTSATIESQGSFSQAITEDQNLVPANSIRQPSTQKVIELQDCSSQPVTEDRKMAPPDPVSEPSTIQKAIESQVYSSQTITEDQEMEAGDTVENSLPSKGAVVATESQKSPRQLVTDEQERQEMGTRDSRDSVPLPPQKPSAVIEAQVSVAMLIREESITASLQSSPQSKTRNPTPLVSSDYVGNISSPVQDLRPLNQDSPVQSPPCSTMPGEISCLGSHVYLVIDLLSLRVEIWTRDVYYRSGKGVE